ncbi:MAG: response regulator [Deltaproteobacteria bacterium]|nr:response regulator [Deltaproteobacteria bacterium]
MTKRILVVDDEHLVSWSLEKALSEAGYSVDIAATGEEARQKFETLSPHVVLLDVRLPDASGLNLLQEFKAQDKDVIIIMITAYADVDSAVQTLRDGAEDYVGKPFDLENIKHTVKKALEKKYLRQQVDYFHREIRRKYTYDNLIGNSLAMIQVFKMIKICAETDVKTVLILGESGTGKELVANSIHFHSARSEAPFIEINCAAIPENLLENELFGHERGAYTDAGSRYRGIFESAEGGTVFLDEIGDMPLAMQAKILKVIDNKKFRRLGGGQEIESDVRIIAASNQDLLGLVNEKKFRGDLFFRLNVMNIPLPPLRERKEDITALVNYFIERLNEEYGRAVKGISEKALNCLMNYNWPGNVRELRNAVERAMMLEQGKTLSAENFNHDITSFVRKDDRSFQDEAQQGVFKSGNGKIVLPPEGIAFKEVEKDLIRQALGRYRGNQTKAAKCLRITRDTLRYRMKKYDFQLQEWKM